MQKDYKCLKRIPRVWISNSSWENITVFLQKLSLFCRKIILFNSIMLLDDIRRIILGKKKMANKSFLEARKSVLHLEIGRPY